MYFNFKVIILLKGRPMDISQSHSIVHEIQGLNENTLVKTMPMAACKINGGHISPLHGHSLTDIPKDETVTSMDIKAQTPYIHFTFNSGWGLSSP